MLDTKTLSKETIKECRNSAYWLKCFVKKHAPEGTVFCCDELWVNDVEGDEYIFCEVTLTCNKCKHCFNFYAGTDACTLVERLGGKKGDEAVGDTYGKSFEMEFSMPSQDGKGNLEEFLERLDKYVPKKPKKPKKATKHVYLLTIGWNETLYETREKAQKVLAKEAKDAIDRIEGINDITIDENGHTKQTALKALKGGVNSFSMTGDLDGKYYVFEAKITEKDIF